MGSCVELRQVRNSTDIIPYYLCCCQVESNNHSSRINGLIVSPYLCTIVPELRGVVHSLGHCLSHLSPVRISLGHALYTISPLDGYG